MRYTVAIIDTEGWEAKLANSFGGKPDKPRSVYVVGLEDTSDFALALNGQPEPFVIRELTSDILLNFAFSEAIGTESEPHVTLDDLVTRAKHRAAQLQAVKGD